MGRILGLTLVVASLVAGALALAEGGAASPATSEFQFSRFNRSYENLVGDLAPFEQGPIRLQLSSPRHVLVLKSHRLLLTPAADGTHQAELEFEFLGSGWLVGDLFLGETAQRLEDELVVPPQKQRLESRVRIARGQSGYLFTPLTLPSALQVEVRSRLGNQFLRLCDGASLLTLGALDCGGLERAFSRVRVPLPPPGDTYLLPDGELTEADRAALDSYLRASSPG